MAKPKPRKRPYVPPPNERTVEGAASKERVKSATPQSARRQFYTAPNGRKMPVPPQPSWLRAAKQLPIYFVIIVAMIYMFPPKGVDGTDRVVIAVTQGVMISFVMLPMLVMLDRMRWARYLKVTGQTMPAKQSRRQAKQGIADESDAIVQAGADDVIDVDDSTRD